jgi:hypothetical protein
MTRRVDVQVTSLGDRLAVGGPTAPSGAVVGDVRVAIRSPLVALMALNTFRANPSVILNGGRTTPTGALVNTTAIPKAQSVQ